MQTQSKLNALFGDRIQWLALLIVACLVSILMLRSQSAASYPSYILLLVSILTFRTWKDVFSVTLVKWVVLLLSWLSLSVLWSENFSADEAISLWIRTALVFSFVIAVAECQLRGQLQTWMGVAMTAVGSLAVIAALANFWLTNPADGRLNGLGQLDTHVIAALVYGVILVFVCHFSSTWGGWRRICALGVAGIAAIAIFYSDSRNAWVSVSLALGAYYVSGKSEDWRQFITSLASIGVVMVVILLLILANEGSREALLPRGTSIRPEIWLATIERFDSLSSFFFGHGILTPDSVSARGLTFDHPHNMYLAVFFQGGMVAVAMFLTTICLTFRELLRNFSTPDARLALSILVLGLSAYLLDGHELIDKIGDTWLLFWLPVGLAVGLALRPRLEAD